MPCGRFDDCLEVRMKLEKFVIGWPMPGERVDRLRAEFPEVTFVVADPDRMSSELADADAVVSWRLSADDLEVARNLKWMQTVGAGVDDIVSPDLIARGILVTNNSGVHASNIAEHVLCMMLAFARKLPL